MPIYYILEFLEISVGLLNLGDYGPLLHLTSQCGLQVRQARILQ